MVDMMSQTDDKKVEDETTSSEQEVQAESAEEVNEESELPDNVEVLPSEKEEPAEEDFKAKYFYLAAEMENMRKRFEREKTNWIKYGNEKILSSLLDVVDNLERTIEAAAKEENEVVQNIAKGVEMVREQFVGVLKKSGLEAVETEGQEFDPNFHEAMAQQEVEGKKEGDIIMEYQKGYVLNGRLLRPAKVIVAKEKK
ncbi:MAG: nucleotide exchange factor GrpE [Halobacteriovoraceae bacterium]|jgi:molecular chaperone GrpE|nr:nucleotide exchange factor GrpE [Halobacteriovoraceae bacterium]MBT5092842.1 nucleotide exchange factor GrpE [Halobacteriovoraceae bacterium]